MRSFLILLIGFGVIQCMPCSLRAQGLAPPGSRPPTPAEQKRAAENKRVSKRRENERKAEQRKLRTARLQELTKNTKTEREELRNLLQIRTWKNETGEFEIEANVLSTDVVKGLVVFNKKDGGNIAVPLSQLGQEERRILDRIYELRTLIWIDVETQWKNQRDGIDQVVDSFHALKAKFDDVLKQLSVHDQAFLTKLQTEDDDYLAYANSPTGIAATAKENAEMAAFKETQRAKEMEDSWTAERLALQGRANRGSTVWMRGCKYSRIGTLYKWVDPDRFHITVSDSKGKLFHGVFLSKSRFESIALKLERGQELDIQGTIKPAFTGQIGGDYAIEVDTLKVIK